MADHPAIVHGKRGSRHLRMGHTTGNAGAASVPDFIHIVPKEAGTEALGPLVAIVIDLRLGMVVGGVGFNGMGQRIRARCR